MATAEDLQRYLIKVCTMLVVEKEKITNFFKRIQQSYAELFFHGKGLI